MGRRDEFFHVTPSYNRQGIEERGISINGGEHQPPFDPSRRAVHFAKGLDDAHDWGFELAEAHERNLGEAHRTMSVFKVDTDGLNVHHGKTDAGLDEHYVEHSIDPKRVSHVKDIDISYDGTVKNVKKS